MIDLTRRSLAKWIPPVVLSITLPVHATLTPGEEDGPPDYVLNFTTISIDCTPLTKAEVIIRNDEPTPVSINEIFSQ